MDDMTFSCSVCSKIFSSKKNLKNHSYIHAETEETCECGKVFANKIKLRNHRRTHGEREKASVAKCDHCPYESKASNVKRHQKTAHDTKCDECGIPLENTKALKAHKRQNHHCKSAL